MQKKMRPLAVDAVAPALAPARRRAGPDDRRPRAAAGVAAVVAIIGCFAFVVWQVFAPENPDQALLIGDIAPALPMAIAVGLSLRAAWIAPNRRTASAWTLMALAFGAYLGATLLWAWFELVRHVAPWPSLADVGFLAFYPLLLLGLLRLPGACVNAGERLRIGLDVAIVFLASAMAVWYFALGPTAQAGNLLGFTTLLSLAYPVGDLVLVFGVATLLVRGTVASSAPALRLLLLGCCACVVGDIGFANLSLSETYLSGDWPDGFWMVAWTLMVLGLAVECRRTTSPTPPAVDADPDRPSSVAMLPYIAIVAAFTLALVVAWRTVRFPLNGILIGAAAITATVVLRQVTAMRDNLRLNRALHTLATTDSLTHLANRRHFLDVTDLHLHDDHGDELCLIMADLDHFKAINDTYGHAVGDDALSWMANHCLATLPSDAIVGRLGGDEFVALLPGQTLGESVVVAEQLVASIAASLRPVAAGPEHLSVSLGVASAHDCPDVATLLHAADEALYDAKRAGRGRASSHVMVPALAGRPEAETTADRRRRRHEASPLRGPDLFA